MPCLRKLEGAPSSVSSRTSRKMVGIKPAKRYWVEGGLEKSEYSSRFIDDRGQVEVV